MRLRGRSRRVVFVIPERSARHWGICPYLVAGRLKFLPPSLTQTHTSLQPPPRLSGQNGRHSSPAAATPELSWRNASPHTAARPPAEGKCLRESPAEPVFSFISPQLSHHRPVSVPVPKFMEWHRVLPCCPRTSTQGMAAGRPPVPRHQASGNGSGAALGALLLRVPAW